MDRGEIERIIATKEAFEAHIRELLRPDIGDDADTFTEEDFVCDLAEDGWPDFCRWLEIHAEIFAGGELTPRQREQALAYWDAGEDYPADDMRLDPCEAEDCPLRALTSKGTPND